MMSLTVRRTEVVDRTELEWRGRSRLYDRRLVVVHVELRAAKTGIVGTRRARRIRGSIE